MLKQPILVIDDHPQNLKLVRRVLADDAYDLRTAEDAASALRVLESFTPRLILMDLRLPGMDGLDLTRRLRADPATAEVIIIAFTADAMKGDEERALEAGCDGYLTKPIDIDVLRNTVADYLKHGRPGAPTPIR